MPRANPDDPAPANMTIGLILRVTPVLFHGNSSSFAKIGSLLGLLMICGPLFLWHPAKAQSPQSRLGTHGSINTNCGRDSIRQGADIIPWIGCFLLSAGDSARGMLSNHHVDAAVDATGQEAFVVDGTLIADLDDPQRSKSGTNIACRTRPADVPG
jgi:hypothetical protein